MEIGDYSFPNSQQELLEFYVRTRMSEIDEFSTESISETRALKCWVELYVSKEIPTISEPLGIAGTMLLEEQPITSCDGTAPVQG